MVKEKNKEHVEEWRYKWSKKEVNREGKKMTERKFL